MKSYGTSSSLRSLFTAMAALGFALWIAPPTARAESVDPRPDTGERLGPICSAVPSPFDSSLRAYLRRKLARPPQTTRLHQRVHTESSLAQGWYDEGIGHLAAYDWLFAADAFGRALAADEKLAMAHVGLARAYLEMEAFAEADQHLTAAERLGAEEGGSPVAEGWRRVIRQKLVALCAPAQERSREQFLYRQRIDELLQLTGNDSHALTLRGVAAEATVAGRGQGGGEEASNWFRLAIQANPEQLDAHHFLTHAYENLGQLDRALPHAQSFAKGAPLAPHALHMVGHVLARAGKWEESEPWFRRTDLLHRARWADPKSVALMRRFDWHFGHNLRIFAEVEWQLGRRDEACRLLQETAETSFDGWRGTFYETPPLELLLWKGRYREALAGAELLATRGPLELAFAQPLISEALVGLGREAEAKEAAARGRLALHEVEAIDARIPSGRPDLALARGFDRFLDQLLAVRQASPDSRPELLRQIRQRIDAQVTFDSWLTALTRFHRLVGDPPVSAASP